MKRGRSSVSNKRNFFKKKKTAITRIAVHKPRNKPKHVKRYELLTKQVYHLKHQKSRGNHTLQFIIHKIHDYLDETEHGGQKECCDTCAHAVTSPYSSRRYGFICTNESSPCRHRLVSIEDYCRYWKGIHKHEHFQKN